MYTTTSKQQEGCTFKDSHPKCFITTNFDKFHREAFARGGVLRACFRDIQSQRSMDRLPYRQKFLNDRNSKICYHSLKDHPKVSKIAKFRCEML